MNMFVRSALVALWALLAGVCAQNHCVSKTKGSTDGFAIELGIGVMPPVAVSMIMAPSQSFCPPSTTHVGTSLRACDFHTPPDADLGGIIYGYVTRNSDDSNIYVYMTVYCKLNPLQLLGGVNSVQAPVETLEYDYLQPYPYTS